MEFGPQRLPVSIEVAEEPADAAFLGAHRGMRLDQAVRGSPVATQRSRGARGTGLAISNGPVDLPRRLGVLSVGPNLPLDPTPEELSEHVREMAQGQTLWSALKSFVEGLASELHAPAWACSLEICLRSFEEEKVLRVHAHVLSRK